VFTPLVALRNKKFYFQAAASVGTSKSEVFEVVVNNCGSETISIKQTTNPVFGTITLDLSAGNYQTYDLSAAFESSSDVCILEKAEVFYDSQATQALTDSQVAKTEGLNLLIGRSVIGSQTFYVKIQTFTKSMIQKISVNIAGPVSNTVASLTNTVPKFKEELPNELNVLITRDAQGDLVGDESKFSYQSPVAEDEEGHQIVMAFSGLEELLGTMTRVKADGSFTLKIDYNQL
jgi:hypothetical protein